MSSPITSVAEPGENSALASVITQVQPGQLSSSRPARPQKVTSKKKKRPAQAQVAASAQDGSSDASRQEATQHSQQPSTIIASSTAGNTLTSTVPAEPTEKLAITESSQEGTLEKHAKQPQETRKNKKKKEQQSLAKRIIAILTCSSGATVMANDKINNEKTSRPRPKDVVVPPRTPDSKGGSRMGAENGSPPLETTTPGGGTKLLREETGDVMSGSVVPPGSSFVGQETGVGLGLAKEGESEDNDEDDDEDEMDLEDEYLDDDQTEEQRLIMQGGMGIPLDEYGNPHPLLEPIISEDSGRKCLVLDLDETLVHSSFKMIQNADFIVPVEIEGTVHNVYVIKRPGVDEFMRQMGEIYEVVVFTASLSKYADPVLDMLDIHHSVRHRLFRESCYNHQGNYVKDLSQLGREIGDTIIIDNSPASYIFHPANAVPISSWFNDPHDTELTDLCPFLADLCHVDDVRAVLDGGL